MPLSEDAFYAIVDEWKTRTLEVIAQQNEELVGLKHDYLELFLQAVGERGLKHAHRHGQVMRVERVI